MYINFIKLYTSVRFFLLLHPGCCIHLFTVFNYSFLNLSLSNLFHSQRFEPGPHWPSLPRRGREEIRAPLKNAGVGGYHWPCKDDHKHQGAKGAYALIMTALT